MSAEISDPVHVWYVEVREWTGPRHDEMESTNMGVFSSLERAED